MLPKSSRHALLLESHTEDQPRHPRMRLRLHVLYAMPYMFFVYRYMPNMLLREGHLAWTTNHGMPACARQ